MGDVGGRGDVGDAPGRVGGSLDPDELGGARPDGGGNGVGAVGIDEVDFQTPVRRKIGQPVAQRPVHDLGHDHMVAGRQRQEAGGRRAHARGKDQRLGPAFERRESGLGLVERRIIGAGVDPARAVAVVLVPEISARHVDRWHHRFGHRIDPPHRLGGEGSGSKFLVCHRHTGTLRMAYEWLTWGSI
jgi:hypothetical protein